MGEDYIRLRYCVKDSSTPCNNEILLEVLNLAHKFPQNVGDELLGDLLCSWGNLHADAEFTALEVVLSLTTCAEIETRGRNIDIAIRDLDRVDCFLGLLFHENARVREITWKILNNMSSARCDEFGSLIKANPQGARRLFNYAAQQQKDFEHQLASIHEHQQTKNEIVLKAVDSLSQKTLAMRAAFVNRERISNTHARELDTAVHYAERREEILREELHKAEGRARQHWSWMEEINDRYRREMWALRAIPLGNLRAFRSGTSTASGAAAAAAAENSAGDQIPEGKPYTWEELNGLVELLCGQLATLESMLDGEQRLRRELHEKAVEVREGLHKIANKPYFADPLFASKAAEQLTRRPPPATLDLGPEYTAQLHHDIEAMRDFLRQHQLLVNHFGVDLQKCALSLGSLETGLAADDSQRQRFGPSVKEILAKITEKRSSSECAPSTTPIPVENTAL